jgi:hypothetical protein
MSGGLRLCYLLARRGLNERRVLLPTPRLKPVGDFFN